MWRQIFNPAVEHEEMTCGSSCCDERENQLPRVFLDAAEGLRRSPDKPFIFRPYSFSGVAAVWIHTAVVHRAAKVKRPATPLTKSNLLALHSVLTLLLLCWDRECKRWRGEKAKPNVSRSDARDIAKPPLKHGGLAALSRSRSIDSSWFTTRAALHKSHCSRDSHPDWSLKLWCLVDITQHKNANASGTVIPQQLRDNEPLCNGSTSMANRRWKAHVRTVPICRVSSVNWELLWLLLAVLLFSN